MHWPSAIPTIPRVDGRADGSCGGHLATSMQSCSWQRWNMNFTWRLRFCMFCLLCIMEFENHFPISTGRVLGCLSGMLQDLNFSSAALAVSRQIPGRRWTLLSLSSCLALSAENDLITLLFWDGFCISVCKQSHLTNQLHLVTLCYTCKNAFACAQTAEYRHKYMHFFFKVKSSFAHASFAYHMQANYYTQ